MPTISTGLFTVYAAQKAETAASLDAFEIAAMAVFANGANPNRITQVGCNLPPVTIGAECHIELDNQDVDADMRLTQRELVFSVTVCSETEGCGANIIAKHSMKSALLDMISGLGRAKPAPHIVLDCYRKDCWPETRDLEFPPLMFRSADWSVSVVMERHGLPETDWLDLASACATGGRCLKSWGLHGLLEHPGSLTISVHDGVVEFSLAPRAGEDNYPILVRVAAAGCAEAFKTAALVARYTAAGDALIDTIPWG